MRRASGFGKKLSPFVARPCAAGEPLWANGGLGNIGALTANERPSVVQPSRACAQCDALRQALPGCARGAGLELRERSEHVKDKPTLRRRRIERLGQTPKPDAFGPKLVDGLDELLHRTRQAVELPQTKRVAAAHGAKRPHEF